MSMSVRKNNCIVILIGLWLLWAQKPYAVFRGLWKSLPSSFRRLPVSITTLNEHSSNHLMPTWLAAIDSCASSQSFYSHNHLEVRSRLSLRSWHQGVITELTPVTVYIHCLSSWYWLRAWRDSPSYNSSISTESWVDLCWAHWLSNGSSLCCKRQAARDFGFKLCN